MGCCAPRQTGRELFLTFTDEANQPVPVVLHGVGVAAEKVGAEIALHTSRMEMAERREGISAR